MSDKLEPINETVNNTEQGETVYAEEPARPEDNTGMNRESLDDGSEFRQQI